MDTESEQYLTVLKASYDYEPQSEDEIAIKENQLLFLLERVDEDWWKVKVKGESQDEESPHGLVPAAYVEPADHISTVKVLYDYDANAPGELSVKEDEVLLVFDKEDDWLLVQSQNERGTAGFVPSNYVEETNSEENAATPPATLSIVVPPSPQRPVSTYMDPADRVASTKVKADDIKTWSVADVDKKGKKKKGTLGVGNGAVFFASESDKTPVQRWQTADIQHISVEKSKHVHIDVGGPTPINLHFNVGSRDNADAIVAKLESSKELSTTASLPQPHETNDTIVPSIRTDLPSPHKGKKNGASVHFSPASPAIIPPREPSDDEDENAAEPEEEPAYDAAQDLETGGGESATALYDFHADGDDELSVQEGETLVILEKDGDEWWKCRNSTGAEGVVPASYLELASSDSHKLAPTVVVSDKAEDDDSAAREAEERAAAARMDKERTERERKEKIQKKLEADRRTKAAAAAAEVDRKKQEKERMAAEATAQRQRREREEAERAEKERTRSPAPKVNGESSPSSRTSTDRRGPPPDKTRIWHDRTGQFRVEAAFLGFNNGKLRLHKVNGVVIEVPSEKMSHEDMRFVEKVTKKRSAAPARKSSPTSDDDQPLAERRKSLPPSSSRTPPSKKGPTIDWFEFFLSAGCDIDDCTRYATSFERDKIDEAILPDITDATMRSLGLREGDIIRVTKVISQRKPQAPKSNDVALQEQLLRDEEYARKLQTEDGDGSAKRQTTSPAPNLFAGPDGSLKPRRGRPQPSKSLPPSNVDLNAISTASSQIKRTGSPLVASPDTPASSVPVQPPHRSSSAMASGFDDDAWTNRPSSTRPIAPTPPAAAARAPSAPPAQTALAPPSLPPQAPVQPNQPQRTGSSLAKTTESDIFEQLSRLSELRMQSPPSAQNVSSPPAVSPPVSYQSGLGMGPSPVPIGHHLQNQPTGLLPQPQQQPPLNGPRGPYAPVPVNQSLLQPLIPTNTGFNNFVPTRPGNATSPFQGQPPQPSFLASQPTGFPGSSQPMLPSASGYPSSGPLLSQPTGLPNGGFGLGTNSFQNSGGFGSIQSNPTGFNPNLGQMPFNNGVSSPPPVPSLPSSAPNNNTSPANVFAQMKSGAFASGNDSTNPQASDKYDALRPNPLMTQATGWGYQGGNTFQGGYMGYQH